MSKFVMMQLDFMLNHTDIHNSEENDYAPYVELVDRNLGSHFKNLIQNKIKTLKSSQDQDSSDEESDEYTTDMDIYANHE
jgi:hypothetical protein